MSRQNYIFPLMRNPVNMPYLCSIHCNQKTDLPNFTFRVKLFPKEWVNTRGSKVQTLFNTDSWELVKIALICSCQAENQFSCQYKCSIALLDYSQSQVSLISVKFAGAGCPMIHQSLLILRAPALDAWSSKYQSLQLRICLCLQMAIKI